MSVAIGSAAALTYAATLMFFTATREAEDDSDARVMGVSLLVGALAVYALAILIASAAGVGL